MAATSIFSIPRLRKRTSLSRPVIGTSTEPGKVAVVVPALGEAENLPNLLERICTVLDPVRDYEILVVDDDSRDGTAEIVAAVASHHPRVRLLVRKDQRGLAGAVLHGWANTDAAIVGVMDADLQHPPELLPHLIQAVRGGCDLAIGSRYVQTGAISGWNPLRRLVSAIAVCATWPIQRKGLRASDPMSGFFVVRRDCLLGIPFQRSGFKLLLELLVRARISSIQELPFAFGKRLRGSSKAGVRVAVEYVRLLARLYWGKFGFGADAEGNSVLRRLRISKAEAEPGA